VNSVKGGLLFWSYKTAMLNREEGDNGVLIINVLFPLRIQPNKNLE